MSLRHPPGGSARERAGIRRAGRATAGVVVLVAFTMSAAAAASASIHHAGNASRHPKPSARPTLHFTLTGPRVARSAIKARFAVLPYRHPKSRLALARAAIIGSTVPNFSNSVVAGQDGNTYGYTMVGQDPSAGGAGSTTISAQVIPVVVTDGSSGDVYDPTTANTGCGEPVSPVTGMLTGPLLSNHRWYAGGRYVGTDEYIGAQMREEFWAYANRFGVSPAYHVRLSGSEPAVANVTFNGGTEVNPGTCSQLEEFPISTWDSYLQGTLFPQLLSFGVSPTTFPVFLFKNVVFTGAGCCIIGYHSAFNFDGGTQTYGVGDYITDGQFGGITDLAALSHEVGEWANDPFVNNGTPSWGHTGQVSGCQGNLEVGDPLTGTDFAVKPTTIVNPSPTYHLQELAFFGWFYDDNIGVNGWYSTRGTFTSGATLCS